MISFEMIELIVIGFGCYLIWYEFIRVKKKG